MPTAPLAAGAVPLIMVRRAGTQLGHSEYARVKRAPVAASQSRFGVCSTGWPSMPRASPRCWSVRIRTMFGWSLAMAMNSLAHRGAAA